MSRRVYFTVPFESQDGKEYEVQVSGEYSAHSLAENVEEMPSARRFYLADMRVDGQLLGDRLFDEIVENDAVWNSLEDLAREAYEDLCNQNED